MRQLLFSTSRPESRPGSTPRPSLRGLRAVHVAELIGTLPVGRTALARGWFLLAFTPRRLWGGKGGKRLERWPLRGVFACFSLSPSVPSPSRGRGNGGWRAGTMSACLPLSLRPRSSAVTAVFSISGCALARSGLPLGKPREAIALWRSGPHLGSRCRWISLRIPALPG